MKLSLCSIWLSCLALIISCTGSPAINLTRDFGDGFSNTGVRIQSEKGTIGPAPFDLFYSIHVVPVPWAPQGKEYGDRFEANFGSGWTDITNTAKASIENPSNPEFWLVHTFDAPGQYVVNVRVTYWNGMVESNSPLGRIAVTVLPPEDAGS